MNTLTIATRESQLARWQANHIKECLSAHNSDLNIKLLPLKTKGDIILDQSLSKIGGKGLFVKELERALLESEADIAVHSMKDMPMKLPAGLCLPVICERASPLDALLSLSRHTLEGLPKGASVGSSSLRRGSQLLRARPDLKVVSLRGNVNTRLKALEAGKFDAIVLAQAGIDRLGVGLDYATPLTSDICLPACGQGALGIECREDDEHTRKLIAALHDDMTSACVIAERALVRKLEGSCQAPIGAHAHLKEGIISLTGLVASIDGARVIIDMIEGTADEANHLGTALGARILEEGGAEILAEYR